MAHPRGSSLIELAAGLAILALLAGVVWPKLGELRRSALAAAGARHLAASLHGLRWRAVAGGRAEGMLFARDAAGWSWQRVRDGNGNGLSTAEVEAGVDPTLSGPHRLEEVARGVTLGFPPGGPFPRIPPATGWITGLDDPIRIGNSELLSFGPLGTSSSGTLYLTDTRRRLYAVVLYGQTARVRVWRYDAEAAQWSS